MPLDLDTFVNAVAPTPSAVLDPALKWPVFGYTIMEAYSVADELGEFVMLSLDGNGEMDVPYALRPGDPPAMPFATELYREIEQGLISIEPLPVTSP